MRLVLVVSVALLASPAIGKELRPQAVNSNSILQDAGKGLIYDGSGTFDGKASTMWIEAEASAGLGKYVEVVFPTEVELKKIRIWAGCFTDKEYWGRHNRLKGVELKFSDFTAEKFELQDVMEPQWIELLAPKKLTSFKMYLRSVYEGSTWNDTAISEMKFYDAAGEEALIVPVSATASSELKDETGGDWSAANTIDGWTDTWWVEGGGSGVGESVTVQLGGSHKVAKFGIATGFTATESYRTGSNRASEVKLTFSDGSHKTLALKDSGEVQVFDLGVTTSSVQVTVTKVTKGASHDDLYIGELQFWR